MKINVNKHMLLGTTFGLTFPLMAWTLDIFLSGLTLSPASLVLIHQNNPTHYIINTAPVVLGTVFYFLGRAYQRILKSETRLYTILSTMIDGLITMDEMGTVESFNPSSEARFGYSAKEVIGQNIKMLMPPHFSDNHEQYLKNYRDTGKINVLGKIGREVEGKRKNGTVFPLAVSISEMHIGGVRKFSAVIRDITEVKQAQAQTKRIADELTQLVDTANAPIFGIDSGGFVNEWNQAAAKITGFEKAEVLGKDLVAGFITDEYKAPVKEVLDNALRGEETANYEFPLYTKDGRRVDVLLNATTRRDVDDNIIGVIGVGQDITALRQKEVALNQAQKMEAVGQLTGGIAHDFNNLLSVIGGNLRNLKEDLVDVSIDTQELLEDAMSAAHDGAELTAHLLSFSRIHILKPKIIEVNKAIIKFNRFAARTLSSSVNFTMELSQTETYINVDLSLLDNTLLNLVINSRDAMPKGGDIAIKVESYHHAQVPLDDSNSFSDGDLSLDNGDYIIISVTDTGTGIAAKDLAHVYEPFFTTKQVGHGSGLGLSMVQGFAKQSKGDCRILSSIGKGTSVSIYFPQVKAPENIDKVLDDENLLSTSEVIEVGSARELVVILVVEDDPRVKRVTLRDLKKLGYTTLEAINGDMAKKIIDSGEKIDLLLSDVLMPGEMNGHMLAEWTNKNYPKIKIILTSGFSKPKNNDSESKWPMIKKPYLREELSEQIRETLLGATKR